MTGSDVAPLGSQAATHIHKLFDWAKMSNRGLLLFIDESDAFLYERNKTYMSEAQRSALNALLLRTGDQFKDIVLALATDRPGNLDSTVLDHINEVLEFPLPGKDERFKLIKLYLDKSITQLGARKLGFFSFKKQAKKIDIKVLNDEVIMQAARKIENALDSSLFHEIVDCYVAQHGQRKKLFFPVSSLLTTATPKFLNLLANDLSASSNLWNDANYGEGMVIGVVDTGIDWEHPSFGDQDIRTPPAKWAGRHKIADFFKGFASKKLVRAIDVDGLPPLDTVGHGTHVAAIAAGN